ncbi:MAG: S-layer homology domain-containing protein, partial [Brachybacterium sp.]
VNRDAMAAFLYRLAGSPHVDAPRTEPFTDVEEGDEHYEAIIWAYQQGITRGWSDGTFRPTTPIARDAMAAFVYRYAGSPEFADPTSAVFKDVPANTQFATEIAWMKSEGISTGWTDGTYRPLNATNRDATAAFLYRLSVDQQITYLSEQD